ncbi:MAG: T9SS type A sorting domain-containing protein [Chryseolinea sp.]
MFCRIHNKSYINVLLVVGVILWCSSSSIAQLKTFPLPPSKGQVVQRKTSKSNARVQALTPRKLPFWDDFSFARVNVVNDTFSNQPVDSLWVRFNGYKNKSVWINNGIGLNPPSVNVATFDGLGADFLPYSTQVLDNGFRDSLVSQPILLGEPNVSLAERNSVFLSFYYQWEGNGEAPDPSDYFQVEFKSNTGLWEPVMTIYPRTSFSRSVFYDTLVKVADDKYFHDAFQFRFTNYGRQSGPYDTWNIDYIYLNKNRSATEIGAPDQAIASSLSGLFNSYQSMPYDHFISSGAVQSPKFDVYNVLNDFTDLTYLTEATFLNYLGNTVTETFVSNLGGTDTSAINDDNSGIIFPLEKRTVTMQYTPTASDPSQFDPLSDSVLVKLKVKLFTGDTFNPKTGELANDYSLNYLPIDFRVNDTINAQYWLKDYYAYDDGVAEYAAGLTQPGNLGAVAFDMLTADPDTLVGFDIYTPDYGLISNLTTNFYIYNDKDGLPGDIIYTRPSVVLEAKKGQNKFQRIVIGEPFLVATRFYLAWKAPVGGILKIGLDYNNNSDDKIFVNTNGSWSSSPGINGSLMIRPVFGPGGPISAIPEEISQGVFPNPNNGEFYVRDDFDKLSVHNITGQSVGIQIESTNIGYKVTLHQPTPGLYVVKLLKGNKISTGKIIVK